MSGFSNLASLAAGQAFAVMGTTATLWPVSGAALMRVSIVPMPDHDGDVAVFGATRMTPAARFRLRMSEVPDLAEGDQFQIDGDGRRFRVSAPPERKDPLGLMWTVSAEEIG